ncbi:cell division protein FtsQ/DivIB [Pseudorhodobacter sp. MZDSW-24AT]|uniref:cell division protein FtsQ/DivIB n=1 Tax=Pseudorhodobacter sp. MZDSW-24AT TaxID=2052957 RepID=UPI000C1F6769|nr:cell division protein FtsQ/DivIB [Pseudorhodobacter sp. MZDSW-24AT]PJF08919.1 cell division protein FtsQ [Pseudorhodobacter sp. MZDSW-24AT]
MQPLSAPRRTPTLTVHPLRRDPAPSRWAYRMQRLWLTPLFRVMFRVGVPTFVLALVVGLVLADEDRRTAIAGGITEIRTQFQNRPEFMVGLVSVVGASPELADVVRARLDLKLPQSSFDIDLVAARARIQELDAIARADLIVRSGGVLEVAITEREPALLWRTEDGIEMLDASGHRVASLAARSDRPDLPLIAGEAADSATPEALALLAAAAPIADRVRGLVRVGERRWDVVLDRNQRILLPEEKPIAAIERLIALHQAGDLLGRDILTVDLRTEHRPVLRLAPYALSQLRQSQGIDISGSQL